MELKEYLESYRDKPFTWEDNNCLTFVCGYHKGIFPVEWTKGYSDTRQALKAYKANLKKFGYTDIIEAVDDYAYRELTLFPRDGFIVAKRTPSVMGHVFGLVYAGYGHFLVEGGVSHFDIEHTDKFWNVE